MAINTEAVLIGKERRQAYLDPLLSLLPVQPEAKLERRPSRSWITGRICFQPFSICCLSGFPHSPPLHREEEIMVIAGIPTDQLLHTRAAQDLLDRGRQEGEARGEAKVTLRLLNRRCGPLADVTTARIQALPLKQLETLAVDAVFSGGVALLNFRGPADLAAWLEEHKV